MMRRASYSTTRITAGKIRFNWPSGKSHPCLSSRAGVRTFREWVLSVASKDRGSVTCQVMQGEVDL